MIIKMPRQRLILLTLAGFALVACSPPADQAEPSWQQRPGDTVEEAEVAPPGEGRPSLSQFSDDEISMLREFSDDSLTALSEANVACDLLEVDELAESFGGKWTEGSFRWFENELQIAPAALAGICVWQQLEYRTSVTLRVYEASELAWASLLQHDDGFARRFYERHLTDGPELGNDAYRKPMGADGYDGSCVLLEEHIICLSASARHTERWTEADQQLLGLAAARLGEGAG